MFSRRGLFVGLIIAAALVVLDVRMFADPNCSKAAIFNTEQSGGRDGCGSASGCHWRECLYSGGGPSPSNYADGCDAAECEFGEGG